ncbi:MAG: nitroreductase family protein [Mailhella sp.]|nr:nitroreductase family protein [Mailhella sp.]
MILEAGRIAPTAGNRQPQRFYMLKSEKALAKAKEVTPFTYGAPVMLLVCFDSNAVWKNPREAYWREYDSGEQDASIAATTMMYAAWDLGIHSLWIRGFDASKVKETFDLPENIIPVMMLSLGYPSDESQPHPWHFKRNPIEDFVTEL